MIPMVMEIWLKIEIEQFCFSILEACGNLYLMKMAM